MTFLTKVFIVVFGGVIDVCLLLDPRFAGLIPAESDGFLMAIKSAACLPLEGKQSRWRHVRFYMLKIPFKYEQI
jgi:hypothetical protein